MDPDSRIKAYKFVAYSAAIFSVVAVLSVVVALPMVYKYVSSVRQQMKHEIKYCKVSTEDLHTEIHHLKTVPVPDPKEEVHNRTSRQSGYGQAVVNPAVNIQCDGCCVQGPPGPTGPWGKPGKPGKPGTPGRTAHICMLVLNE
ncbi:hypothetical protein QR680_015699 [Steinernema hermaphroditum]|uniref:Nematode cuticle collagen N-terminal domain-containing protein n=1 Tax=Steinernema hermaphroditum TaxID=289476 RepID=A0AA39LLC7_9BILA|nr:hypothetical protein QR680_015699 [Steinernema hermaphroditum]